MGDAALGAIRIIPGTLPAEYSKDNKVLTLPASPPPPFYFHWLGQQRVGVTCILGCGAHWTSPEP
eukprot:3239541-Rhodomonas_salina.1